MNKQKRAQVSVIIPIYNAEKYLEKCITSVIVQNISNIEIILVNDGSNDKSANICDEFARIDNRIKVIHKSNGGSVSARKEGLKASTAPYITWIDSDDWIKDGLVDILLKAIQKYETDVAIINNYYNVYEDEIVTHNSGMVADYYCGEKLDELYSNIFTKIQPSFWQKIFKRELMEEYLNAEDSETTIGEDVACVIPALLSSKSIVIIDDRQYYYRQIETSMSHTYKKLYIEKAILLYEQLKKNIFNQNTIYQNLNLYFESFVYRGFRELCSSKNNKNLLGVKCDINNIFNNTILKEYICTQKMITTRKCNRIIWLFFERKQWFLFYCANRICGVLERMKILKTW